MATHRFGRRWVMTLWAILLVATAGPSLAQSPTLGDIAKKEQERRKGTNPSAKVLTNDDLKNNGMPSAPAEDPSRPADAAKADGAKADGAKKDAPGAQAENKKASKESKDGDESNAAKGEDAWRARITSARDELRRNEVFVEALQSRINALTTDFAARDNPVERAQIADERQKALQDLERVKADVEKSKKMIADIEEEARKAGVPPGWLR
jgi:hypothetical protein